MSDDPRPSGRTTIAVRCKNPKTWMPVGSGTVIVDGERVGRVIGGRSRVFRLLPGTHFVEIQVGSLRSNAVDVALAQGEHASLAFAHVGLIPSFGIGGYLAAYIILLPFVATLSFSLGNAWQSMAMDFLLSRPLLQGVLPPQVAYAVSSWFVLVLAFTLIWIAGLPLLVGRRSATTGLVLDREARAMSLSPIDQMVLDPGPMPSDHLCVQAALKARSASRRGG